MHLTVKRVIRLVLVGAIAIAAVFVLGEYFGYDQLSPANAECLDGRTPCENTACITACWEDGTVHNAHTKAVKTTKQPLDCSPGSGGCVTRSCN